MSFKLLCSAVSPLFVLLFSLAAFGVDLSTEYLMAIGDYYNVSYEEVAAVSELVSDEEDIPVVFKISEKTGVEARKIAEIRRNGHSWQEVNKFMGLSARDYYVIANGEIKSKVFKPVFQRYKNSESAQWIKIDLSDDDIVNLVNLKFLYSHYDYSVFEIMAMRDYGKTYARINQQVKESKRKMLEKQVAQKDKGNKE